MNLSAYIQTFSPDKRLNKRTELAKKIGISEIYLRQMCSGRKRIPEKYAPLIEKATDGAVKREDISPHMYE